MAIDFPTTVSRTYINRTSNGYEAVAISYSANQPFYFTCSFLIGWDGTDDKYFMSLQNGDADGNVFNYGIYTNRLLSWSGLYDTGTLAFSGVKRRLELVYNGTTLYVYLDGELQNSRAVSIAAATVLRIGEYHNYATADSWIGELWDWGFVLGNKEYLASNGNLYLFDGGGWTTLSKNSPSSAYPSLGARAFKYRSIYSRGYVSGGYQSSSPWKNVNRTVHYTDTTVNLGDIMDTAASYTDGSYSDYYQYIYSASASWPGTGSYTTAVNMTNETGRTHSSNFDLKTSPGGYGDVGVIINGNLTVAWILSDQTYNDKHNLVTETTYSLGTGGTCGTPGDFICTWYGQYYGWVKHSYAGSRNHKIEYSTETWSAGGLTVGTDGWGKALPTKDGKAYVKNGGNIVSGIYTVNDSTGANINTGLNMPESCGEENFQTGQMWGYSLGNYNGVQNNNTHKITHSTDSIVTMGSSTQPSGHGGMSSAATASASALILGGY